MLRLSGSAPRLPAAQSFDTEGRAVAEQEIQIYSLSLELKCNCTVRIIFYEESCIYWNKIENISLDFLIILPTN